MYACPLNNLIRLCLLLIFTKITKHQFLNFIWIFKIVLKPKISKIYPVSAESIFISIYSIWGRTSSLLSMSAATEESPNVILHYLSQYSTNVLQHQVSCSLRSHYWILVSCKCDNSWMRSSPLSLAGKIFSKSWRRNVLGIIFHFQKIFVLQTWSLNEYFHPDFYQACFRNLQSDNDKVII